MKTVERYRAILAQLQAEHGVTPFELALFARAEDYAEQAKEQTAEYVDGAGEHTEFTPWDAFDQDRECSMDEAREWVSDDFENVAAYMVLLYGECPQVDSDGGQA